MWPNVRGMGKAGWVAMAKLLYRFAWYSHICTIRLVAYITRRMANQRKCVAAILPNWLCFATPTKISREIKRKKMARK